MGKWPKINQKRANFKIRLILTLKYDRSGYNSSHPSLGSPWDLGNPWWPLATLGDPWRLCLKMAKMTKMTIFRHGRQGSPRVANGRQGFPRSKGDPRDGWDELEPNRSYLSHFTTWYSKSGHFPIENPIKNENWPLTPSYRSIILKIVLWAHFTNSHAVLRGSSNFFEKSVFWDRLMWTSKGCPVLVPIRFIDCLLVDTLIGLTPLTKLIGLCFSSQHSAISTKHRKLYNQHNTSRVQKVKCCVK